jgi:5-methylcytosine-specific restriction endonuclease McrA
MRRVSAKKRREAGTWAGVTAEARRLRGDRCEIRVCCTGDRATDGHHIRKRSRGGLNTLGNCKLACRACHDWIETHDAEAKARGWSLSGYTQFGEGGSL